MEVSHPCAIHVVACVLQLTRPVTFPTADMMALNSLNNLLIRTGVVKANAD